MCKKGALVLADPAPIKGRTRFQAKRLAEAENLARIYLTADADTSKLAKSLGLTRQRAAQIIGLGISYLLENGYLREAHEADPLDPLSKGESSSLNRGRG